MSASGMGTGERGEASGLAGVFAGAFWFAKREVRRAWISYPLTGVLLMLMGFYVVPSVSGFLPARYFCRRTCSPISGGLV